MRKIRALVAAAVTAFGLLWGGLQVQAAQVEGGKLTSSLETVRKGEELELTFALEGYSDIEKGICALKGTLVLEPDIFTGVSQEDFETVNSWEKLFYNPDNGQFVLIRRDGSRQAEEVFRLRLTAGEDIPAGEVAVSVQGLSLSEGEEDLHPGDASLTLSAVAQYPGSEPEDEMEAAGEREPSREMEAADETETEQEGAAPQASDSIRTGDPAAALLLPAGALFLSVGAAGVILWEIWRKRGNGRRRILAGSLVLVSAAALTAGTVYAFAGRGELNGDGQTDYTDVELLERHLIGLETLPEDSRARADMNLDGRLTVIDLALLIRKIEGELEYEVELSSVTEKFYYEKGEQAELKLQAKVSHGASIEKVTVDGREYPAQAVEGTSVYTVRPDGGEVAGVQTWHVTEVLLENGKRVKTELTEQTEVLKSHPQVDGFLAEEVTDQGRMRVSFHLADEDQAVESASFEVLEEFLTEPFFSEEAVRGENVFTLDLEENKLYKAHVLVTYDRSSGALDAGGNHGGSLSVVKDVQMNLDYAFTFGGMRTGREDGEQTSLFSKGEPVALTFESSNGTRFRPERIRVNGTYYPVSQAGDGYRALLDGFDTAGEKELRAEQIVLENGRAFDLTGDNLLQVTVLRDMPQVRELAAAEEAEDGQFHVFFRLTDPDGALSASRVQIRKADGQIAGEMAFTEEDLKEGVFDRRISLLDRGLTDSYAVQVRGDLALSEESDEEQGRILGETTLQAVTRAVVTESRAVRPLLEKGEEAELLFAMEHNARSAPSALVIDHLEVPAEAVEGGLWKVSVPAPEQAGVHPFTLSQIVFEDGATANLETEVRAEVLKDRPAVESLTWEKTGKDELSVCFALTDEDGALLEGTVQIEEEGGQRLLDQPVSAGENQAQAALTARESYVITVTADYDRATGELEEASGSGQYRDEVLCKEAVTISRDALELKDIKSQRLYYAGESGSSEVKVLDITGGLPKDTDNYYAVIEMESMPDFYGGISSFRRDVASGRVYAVLDQEELVQYSGDGTRAAEHAFPVAYRDEKGEVPLVTGAGELFQRMAADPGGKFELTEDLDASDISGDVPAVAGTFTGELDGNGFRIRNLPTSLFQTLSGANIHDLVIEDAQVTGQRGGILADAVLNRSLVERVFLVDSSISNSVDGMGAFVGRLSQSTIRESASLQVAVRGLVAVGGIVGKTESGALIEDCYVTGQVQGTYDHPSLGARTGGIAGWHGGGTIRRCYTQARIIAPAKKGNGGLIGGPDKGDPRIEHSISMSTGAGYRIAGFDVLGNVTEVYEYAGSDSSTNITEANRDQVKETDAIYDRALYEETLGFDSDVWDLDGMAHGKRPALQGAPVMENQHGIPSYDSVTLHPDYDPGREVAYSNMAKLMPLSDTRLWVEQGNRLPDSDPLVAGKIRLVLPLDGKGELVTGIQRSGPEEVRTVRLALESGERLEYPVFFRRLTGNVAALYQVEGRSHGYQFPRYVSDMDPSFLSGIAASAAAWDYASDISALTEEEESRLYGDYYNEKIKADMVGMLEKLFSSGDRYPTYSSHPAVRELARERMEDAERLKRSLYAYNYYDKWYRISYGGVYLSELLFFHGDQIAKDMTAETLTDQLLSAPAGQRDTNQAHAFYSSVLKNHTGQELTDFLGSLSAGIAGYEDPNDWFSDSFAGVLVEQAAQGDEKGLIRWRVWDNLCGLEERRKSLVLHILTAPQEDMYMISVPSQLLVGSMNRYPEYLVKDGRERERIRQTAKAYAEKMGIFYGVSSRWMSSAARQLNSFVNVQYDTRLGFPGGGAVSPGIQEKGTTADPVMKWVYEAGHMLSALNDSAAVADGSIVIWMHTPALGTSDYIFFTFSHETAHNQDGRYFYGGAGRRKGTGGEAHADGNIAQEMRDGIMVFNISRVNDMGTEMTNNFSYERIDSAEKVHSYYREMFDTGYALDYLAAQAFFQLTPRQQAAVAVTAEHTPGGEDSMSTVYRRLTEEEAASMDLRSMEALWDNRISIRTGASYPEKVGTATDGSYGFEPFYTMNWYQSHNDQGSPDTHSFKRLGQEMLGLAGYEKGYMVYMSALSENDLDALRKITGDPGITWESYKLGRYREAAQRVDEIPYFDKDEIIARFRAAFEEDAANGNTERSTDLKRTLYGIVKRVTGDFSQGGIYQSPAVHTVSSAEELVRLAADNPYGYYRLEENLDFGGLELSGGSYIPERFMGVLDGNGHQITGLQGPLFGNLQYTLVRNLTILSEEGSDVQDLLAGRSGRVLLENVTVETGTEEDGTAENEAVEDKAAENETVGNGAAENMTEEGAAAEDEAIKEPDSIGPDAGGTQDSDKAGEEMPGEETIDKSP